MEPAIASVEGLVKMGNTLKNVLFDFDGTLVDTSEGIVRSMHYAYDRLGYDRVSDREIRATIGPPLQEMFRQLLPSESAEGVAMGVQFFRERYGQFGAEESVLYPYVREGLERLRRNGKCLFIVTAKPEVFVDRIARKYDILKFFDEVSAVEARGTTLSKAVRIGMLMEKYEMEAEHTVLVGDRHEDAEAAAANGLRCIGAGYGYDDTKVLREVGCWEVRDSFREICDMVDI